MAEFPVGKAQQQVLDALGLMANTHAEAVELFRVYGFEVSSKRVGRASEPVIKMLDTICGGFSTDGDGYATEITYKEIDLSLVAQWIEK
jgi:hypothetical protein